MTGFDLPASAPALFCRVAAFCAAFLLRPTAGLALTRRVSLAVLGFWRVRSGPPPRTEAARGSGSALSPGSGLMRAVRDSLYSGRSATRLTALPPLSTGLRIATRCGTSSDSNASASSSSIEGSGRGSRNTTTLPSGSSASA